MSGIINIFSSQGQGGGNPPPSYVSAMYIHSSSVCSMRTGSCKNYVTWPSRGPRSGLKSLKVHRSRYPPSCILLSILLQSSYPRIYLIMHHLALFSPLILLNPFYGYAICRDVGDRSCYTFCYGKTTCKVFNSDKPSCSEGQILQEYNLTPDGCIDAGGCSRYDPQAHAFKCNFKCKRVRSPSLHTLASLVCA